MRKLFSGMVIAALALSLPTAAHAQRRAAAPSMGGANHEFGVDVGLGYVSSNLTGVVGWRKPYESAAWRYEVGLQWVSSSAPLGLAADYIAIGGRVGISLWH